MAYTPISGIVPQLSRTAGGAAASGYYLKGYVAGDTTPLSMGIDSTPTSTLAKCALNSLGYPISNDADETTVFIPHFNANYKLVLYTNATDADNNTTANAVWVVDNISGIFDASLIDYDGNATVAQRLDNLDKDDYIELRATTSSQLTDGDSIRVTDNSIAGLGVVKTGTVTDDGWSKIVFSDDSNRYWERVDYFSKLHYTTDLFNFPPVGASVGATYQSRFYDTNEVVNSGAEWRLKATNQTPPDAAAGVNSDGYIYSAASSADQYEIVTRPAQAPHFGAIGDGATDDTSAMLAFFGMIDNDVTIEANLGQGAFTFGTKFTITTPGFYIYGADYQGRRSGGTQFRSTLSWNGGADSMFTAGVGHLRFGGFGVENTGTATDFIEFTAGSIKQDFDDIFIKKDTFTRSFIYSGGPYIGYSEYSRILTTRCAPTFIDINGMGSGQGVTPISFTNRCIFQNENTGTGFTVLKTEDVTFDAVYFDKATINSRTAGITLVDTTTNPNSTSIFILGIDDCEFDEVEVSTHRVLDLENVDNISIEKCHINGGSPTSDYFSDLVNCNVSSFKSNYWSSITNIFNADSTSKLRGIGYNGADFSSTDGVSDSATAGITDLTYATIMRVDGAEFGPDLHALYRVEVTDAVSYEFRLDTIRPENSEVGQVYTITVKNTSGGAIAAPDFGSGFLTQAAAFTAPANGFQKSYSFYFDGTNAVQISAETPDVPNT